MKFKIPLSRPAKFTSSTSVFRRSELDEISSIINSGNLTGGEYTTKFEEEFAKYVGVDHCVAINSCASALQLAMSARLLTGSSVIVPSFTFVASANSIVNARCFPRFCDIDDDTLNLDINSINSDVLDKGIMPVNIAGVKYPNEVNEFAAEHSLDVIEDSAEMIMRNQCSGGNMVTTCFSFFPTKNITTGEGGMIATNNLKVAEYCKVARSHGVVRKGIYQRDCVIPGFNFRMTEVQAAMGLFQLRKLDNLNINRLEVAGWYHNRLKPIRWIRVPYPRKKIGDSTWQMYIIRVKAGIRDGLLTHLRDNSVEASVHFDPPVHKTTCYNSGLSLPVTEKVCKEVITLPMYPDMRKSDVDYVVDVIEDFDEGA